MGLYDVKIAKGCVRRDDGKLVCYAYDMTTLPFGATDPSQATRKCEIVFGEGEPQFIITGRGSEKLCGEILSDLQSILRQSSNTGVSLSNISKALQQLSQNTKSTTAGEE